ncbi:MAG: rhizopine-binding protein, partial [Spirochaetaceae bacterium]
AGAQGRGAVQAAMRLIQGESVENFVEIPFEPVTEDNWRDYQ